MRVSGGFCDSFMASLVSKSLYFCVVGAVCCVRAL